MKQDLKKLSDNNLFELSVLLHSVKQLIIKDFLHVQKFANPQILTNVQKQINATDKEFNRREEKLYK